MKRVIELNDENFSEALAGPTPLLVDFTAAWCAPCRVIAPHVEAVAEAHAGALRVGKLDVDDNPLVATKYDVRAMPTLLLFQGGRVVGQIVGAVPRARIEKLIAGVLAA